MPFGTHAQRRPRKGHHSQLWVTLRAERAGAGAGGHAPYIGITWGEVAASERSSRANPCGFLGFDVVPLS